MIWYPARVLPPVGIVAGLILACAHGRGAGESAAVQRPAPPPPSPSTVTSDEIARQPVVSLDQLLAGRIAGVTVTPARGGGISVRISGPTSFSLSNEPLYVVDGGAVEAGPEGKLGWRNRQEDESNEVVEKQDDTAKEVAGTR